MAKTYVTFGQDHTHRINGKTLDKDCVAVFNHPEDVDGRKLAFDAFGPKFCMEYPEQYWREDILEHFPRGLIEVS